MTGDQCDGFDTGDPLSEYSTRQTTGGGAKTVGRVEEEEKGDSSPECGLHSTPMPRHPDPVTVGVPIGAHLLSRLDTVASDLGLDRPEAIHAALLCWLEQAERTTAVRNRMLTIRALTKTDVRPA